MKEHLFEKHISSRILTGRNLAQKLDPAKPPGKME
jgi:hypothetical protein